MRLGVDGEMRVKMGRIIAPDAQDPAALGLPGFGPPEHGGASQGPGRQLHTCRQASFEHITTANTLRIAGVCLRGWHGKPSFWGCQYHSTFLSSPRLVPLTAPATAPRHDG